MQICPAQQGENQAGSTDSQKKHFTISGDGTHSALDLIAQETNLSRQALKRYASYGAIWLKASSNQKPQRLRRLKKILNSEQSLDVYYHPNLLDQTIIPATLVEDMQSYSVWLKPRGMLSQGSKWADHTALYRWVEMHYQPKKNQPRQCWIVHRLDRATCGLMVLAHSKTLANQLTNMFELKQVQKTYLAVVHGLFPDTPQTIHIDIDQKSAVSHIRLLKHVSAPSLPTPASLVEVNIETGRKHQIRKHLTSIGFPIVGDRLHGCSEKDRVFATQPDLQLTAYKLEFECPLEHVRRCYELPHNQQHLLVSKEHA